MKKFMILLMCLMIFAGSASAFVINFDFQAWPGSTSVTYSGQGALPDPGNNYWNSGGNGWETSYSQTNLKASDGTSTDVDFHVTGCKNMNWYDVGNALMSDYKYIDTGPIGGIPTNPGTITFSGLAANTPYRLYVYAAGNAANKGSKFTSNGVAKETTGTVSSQFIEGGNYVILDTMSNAGGQVIVTWALRSGATQAALNGFQITDIIPHASDLSGNGKVAMDDFEILSQSWQNDYEMTTLLRIAEDWLLITVVAFQSAHIIEMDAVEGIAYSSTLSDDLVAFDASQLSLSKLEGPGWLTVATDGTLSGTPSSSDIGLNLFTIQVEDDFGNSDQTRVDIAVNGQGWVAIYPQEYPYALRNPLKGFRYDTSSSNYQQPYVAVTRHYIKWNEIENYESDGIDKIITFCNNKWKDMEKYNVKVIPRVYLDWDGNSGNEHWPADMTTGDYSSAQFKTRLRRLIQRLGQCWNNDPRVAWVQMGIIGYWGEHHSPSPTAEIQQLMGEEFAAAFPNKKVLVRHPWREFTAYGFGGYWDSWAHHDQMNSHGAGIDTLNDATGRWKVNIWEGECAYNWGNWKIQPGDNPTDTVTDPVHRNFLIDTIRNLHCSALGWVSGYNKSDPAAVAGAEEVQRAFGYRYVLEKVAFSPSITNGTLRVVLNIKNVGSAPFYYDWPLEASLLDLDDRSIVWKQTFDKANIRDWLPGEGWTAPEWQNNKPNPNWVNSGTPGWTTPPKTYIVSGDFKLSIPTGKYILAMAVLDPAGNLPSLRFATSQYFKGGRHPIGIVAVNQGNGGPLPEDMVFDDPAADDSLHYIP